MLKKPLNQLSQYELQYEFVRIEKNINDFIKSSENQKNLDLTVEQLKVQLDEMHKIFIEDQAFMLGMVDMATKGKVKTTELLNLKNMVDEILKNIERLQVKYSS